MLVNHDEMSSKSRVKGLSKKTSVVSCVAPFQTVTAPGWNKEVFLSCRCAPTKCQSCNCWIDHCHQRVSFKARNLHLQHNLQTVKILPTRVNPCETRVRRSGKPSVKYEEAPRAGRARAHNSPAPGGRSVAARRPRAVQKHAASFATIRPGRAKHCSSMVRRAGRPAPWPCFGLLLGYDTSKCLLRDP